MVLRCVQTESNERDKRHKITYRVNVKMWLHVMPFRVTGITWYTRCGSHHVASIASSLEVDIELSERHCVTLCRDKPISVGIPPTSMTARWHERCWNLPNGHWIRHGDQNNCCCVWIPQSCYNRTLSPPRDYLMNTDAALLSFSTFLGLPQLRAEMMVISAVVYCRKWQAPLPPDAAS